MCFPAFGINNINLCDVIRSYKCFQYTDKLRHNVVYVFSTTSAKPEKIFTLQTVVMVTRIYIAKEENRDFFLNNDFSSTNHDKSSKKTLICHAGQCLGLGNVSYIPQTVLVNIQTYTLK